MEYYDLEICGLKRKLPIVSLGPKLKIASFNLLGDGELVEAIAENLAGQNRPQDFDLLVGPEVKVVPLLHSLSQKLKKNRYVVCRKQIHGYMVSPVSSHQRPGLVLNGSDVQLVKGQRVILLDDVVSTGETMENLKDLIESVGGKAVRQIAIFKQGESPLKTTDLIEFLGQLPLFKNTP